MACAILRSDRLVWCWTFMPHKSTAWLLVCTTLVGPFTCCCTTAKAMLWVSLCLGGTPIICESSRCCDETFIARRHSHGAKHRHHGHGQQHQHPDAGQLVGKKTPDDQGPRAPKQCPCRHDRDEVVGVPITAGLDAKTLTAPLDFTWLTVALDDTSANLSLVEPGSIASSYCPANVCSNGRGILRAYCVLRI